LFFFEIFDFDKDEIVKLKDFFEENLWKTVYITTDKTDWDMSILSCSVK